MTHTSPTRAAVVGVGRMGRHHARTYAAMDGVTLAGVVDADLDRAETIVEEYGGRAYSSVDALLDAEPDLTGVSVAVPTEHHVAAATPLLQRGVACLVEKPLAATSAAARQLAELAAQHHAVLQVGHTERFNPAVRAAAALGLVPRFMEVDRVSPMTFRSLDVGVVMDMMIHDVDILLTLARSPIVRVDAVGVSVLGDHEDVCDARLTFASGCVATLTGSRLALKTERKLRIFSEDSYVSLNYADRSGLVIQKSGNDTALDDLRSQLAAGADLSDLDFTDLINIEELATDLPPEERDPLTARAASFLRAARGESPVVVTADEGVAAIEAAEQIMRAMAEHRWEGLGSTKV